MYTFCHILLYVLIENFEEDCSWNICLIMMRIMFTCWIRLFFSSPRGFSTFSLSHLSRLHHPWILDSKTESYLGLKVKMKENIWEIFHLHCPWTKELLNGKYVLRMKYSSEITETSIPSTDIDMLSLLAWDTLTWNYFNTWSKSELRLFFKLS